MDAQMTHAQGHHYDQNPLDNSGGVVEGEEEHHEKKSMFSRVKAKARKVRDTLSTKAHNDQDNEHDDEDDQDHEELGAPTTRTSAMGLVVNPIKASSGPTPTSTPTATPAPAPAETEVTDSNSSAPTPSAYDSVAPWDSSYDHDAKSNDTNLPRGTLGEKFGEDTDVGKRMQEDVSPISHPDKISDPISEDEPVSPKRHGADHGVNSGNFKSPLDVPLGEQPREGASFNTHVNSENFKSPLGVPLGEQPTEDVSLNTREQPTEDVSLNTREQPGEDVSLDTNKRHHEDVSPANYQAGHDARDSPADAGVAPILHSFDKMDIHDEPQQKNESVTTASHDQLSPSPIPESFGSTTYENHPQDMNVDQSNTQEDGDYAVADKAISAKDEVPSKIGLGGNDDNVTSENVGDTNVSGLESPKQQPSTYMGMVSSATTAVASKFGYGGTDNAPVHGSEITKRDGGNVQSGDGESPKTQSTYMGMVSSATAATRNAVASKIGYGGTGNAPDIGETHERTTDDMGTGSTRETGTATVGETDKGVGSMKGYISEKLKPSDEDKALSDVISGALGKRVNTDEEEKKGIVEAEEKKGVHESIKDALHKRNTDEDMDRDVPMGKVTESDEVANRLGSSEEERMGTVYTGAGNESPGTGVVDKFKGAFTNWFGKGGETNPSIAVNDKDTQPQGPTGGEDNVSQDGERKPQTN